MGNQKTKILNNQYIDFSSIMSMSIVPVIVDNPNDQNSYLTSYIVRGFTDFKLEFDLFEDLDSGVKDKCRKFIEDNWKIKNRIELAGQDTWIDLDKILATKISERFAPDVTSNKINYVCEIFAVNNVGSTWLVATYTRPKGIDNNTTEVEKFRLKYLK